MDERVLVIPTEVFRGLGYFQGFSREVERYLPVLLGHDDACFKPRAAMEQDPSYKQLIPYALLRCVTDQGPQFFRYTRGTGQGEQRLHLKQSLGVGGHINDIDAADGQSPYELGMRRELDEEVAIAADYTSRIVGLINDDASEVGQVHLGVVHLLDLATADVQPREVDLADAGFVPLRTIYAERERLEAWSQICLDALPELRAS